MSNPNRTVAAFRNRKLFMVKEVACGSDEHKARAEADELRKAGQHHRVVVRSYKIGPRRSPIKQWVVYCYDK